LGRLRVQAWRVLLMALASVTPDLSAFVGALLPSVDTPMLLEGIGGQLSGREPHDHNAGADAALRRLQIIHGSGLNLPVEEHDRSISRAIVIGYLPALLKRLQSLGTRRAAPRRE